MGEVACEKLEMVKPGQDAPGIERPPHRPPDRLLQWLDFRIHGRTLRAASQRVNQHTSDSPAAARFAEDQHDLQQWHLAYWRPLQPVDDALKASLQQSPRHSGPLPAFLKELNQIRTAACPLTRGDEARIIQG